VKEICEAAGANIAAINYHFRDKESLYGEVLKYAHACAESLDDLQMLVSAPIPPDQKFAEFIKHMLRSMFAEGRPAWHGKLMAREMTEPTAALSTMVEHGIRPKFAVLRSIIADILGVPIEHDVVRWYGASVIAQCVFFYTNRPICERLYPDLTYEPEQVERMALHIVRFSLDGLHGAARQLSQVHS
jgi:AcrR family transcriptional regulator